MKNIQGQETHPTMSVQEFLEAFSSLGLTVRAGREGLGRTIDSPSIQKPGLALAGVDETIRPRRIQVIGRTEVAYLNLHDPDIRMEILRPLIDKDVSCFLVTWGLDPPPELAALAEETQIPLVTSKEPSSVVIGTISDGLTSALAPTLKVHGVLLDVFGIGLLIIGEGSIGKSESALDLVVRGHRLVSDDVVEIRRKGETLNGRAPDILLHQMELRGLGIIDIKELFGVVATRDRKDVDLVVELELWRNDGEYDRLGLDERTICILGIHVPYVLMPVAPGRNVAILLEVAARNILLKRKGIHSARTFARRLKEIMESSPDDDP